MAQNRIFRDASVNAAVESRYIIYAFAHKDTGPEQILIYVRHRKAVDIYRGITSEKPGKQSPADTLRSHFYTRLKYRVAGDQSPCLQIKAGRIFRMGQRSCQLCHGTGRQNCIDIDGNDETNAK